MNKEKINIIWLILIRYSVQHQIIVELWGHNLILAYDRNIPEWLLEQGSSMTSDKAKSLLSNYIHTVFGCYRGKIQWWDVINEAISDYYEIRAFNLCDSLWFRKLEPEFTIYAFQFAHEVDHDTKLFYNEYYIEHWHLLNGYNHKVYLFLV